MALSHSESVRFVIVGGGSAGWIAASLLQHHGKAKNWQITLVEANDIAPIGVGEGSTPYLKHFFKQLGIAETEWMPACQATYKVGIEFPGWSTQPGFESYFHPFFTPLDLKSGEAFMAGACARRRGHKTPAHPDSFWVSSAMARQKRSPIAKKPLPFEIDYGYHFDAGLLGQFLKQRAVKLGVRHIVDKVDRVEKNNHGDIARLHCQDVVISGDVFIDCSGFSQRLIGDELGSVFVSYEDYLFNDRAIALASGIDTEQAIPPYTESRALSAGWRWRIPLTSRYGNGYVFSSRYLTDEQAEAELRASLPKETGQEQYTARVVLLKVGRLEQHWKQNCLAVGLSQGFIEPLEATALMLVQFTVEKFIRGFSQVAEQTLARHDAQTQFNQTVNANFDGIRDYIVAHYYLNSRTDSQYWRDCREKIKRSDRLTTLLDTWDKGEDFEATLSQFKGEVIYGRPSWYCLLAGMGRFQAATFSADETEQSARAYCEKTAELFELHDIELLAAEVTQRIQAEPA